MFPKHEIPVHVLFWISFYVFSGNGEHFGSETPSLHHPQCEYEVLNNWNYESLHSSVAAVPISAIRLRKKQNKNTTYIFLFYSSWFWRKFKSGKFLDSPNTSDSFLTLVKLLGQKYICYFLNMTTKLKPQAKKVS